MRKRLIKQDEKQKKRQQWPIPIRTDLVAEQVTNRALIKVMNMALRLKQRFEG
jgi:hypothetical protein